MKKKIIVRGDIKNLTFEECLEMFEAFKNKMIRKYSHIQMEREDLEQEINIAILETYNYYDIEKGAQFITLLYMIVPHHIQKIVRNNTKEQRKANFFTDSLYKTYGKDERLTLLDTLTSKDDFTTLIETTDLLNRLDINTQRIIKLIYKGYSQREVGLMIGCSQAQVSRILRKNALKLKEVS